MKNNLELFEQQKKRDEKKTRRFLWGVGVGFFVGAMVAIFMPLLVTYLPFGSFGTSKPNEIGDTIGGIMGPSVGLIGAILTFLAFYAQIKANTEQRHQFRQSLIQQQDALEKQTQQFQTTIEQQENALKVQKEQAADQLNIAIEQAENSKKEFLLQDVATRRERFANRYYMMLAVHRDNVAAFDVGRQGKKHTGRRALLSLFNELEFLYWKTIAFHKNKWLNGLKKPALTSNELYQISYLSFFFGFGETSTPMVLDLVGENLIEFTRELHQHFKQVKEDEIFQVNTPQGNFNYDNEYVLGTGHLRRLSHYFRHLYQTVKYVDDQDHQIIDYAKKYSYVSNLRAQLSVHEQLLLYYNARSVLGKPWLDFDPNKGEKEGLLARYCMIKSIPLNTADFFERPETFFNEVNKEGKPMFEWTDIQRRMQNI